VHRGCDTGMGAQQPRERDRAHRSARPCSAFEEINIQHSPGGEGGGEGALFAIRSMRTCANERGEVQTPSRFTDLNHKSAGQTPTERHWLVKVTGGPSPPQGSRGEGRISKGGLAQGHRPQQRCASGPSTPVGVGWNTHGTPMDVPPDRPKK